MYGPRFTENTPAHYIAGALFLLLLALVYARAWWQARRERIDAGLHRWAVAEWLQWMAWRSLYLEELTRHAVPGVDAAAWARGRRRVYLRTSYLQAAAEDYHARMREPMREFSGQP